MFLFKVFKIFFCLLNRKDEFMIKLPSVGELKKVSIEHDGTGVASGWFLDRIIIEDLNANRNYEVLFNKWLG